MKCLYALLVVLVVTGKCYSTDTLLTAKYKIEKFKSYNELIITCSFEYSEQKCDTCKNIFQKFFPGTQLRTGPSFSDLDQVIVNEFYKTGKVKLYLKIPDYIENIIDLIKKKEDREKAKELYTKHNLSKATHTNSNSSTSMKDGVTDLKMEYTFGYDLKIVEHGVIRIPEFKFVYSNIMYTIQSFEINL